MDLLLRGFFGRAILPEGGEVVKAGIGNATARVKMRGKFQPKKSRG
jgi:hypothetical protein